MDCSSPQSFFRRCRDIVILLKSRFMTESVKEVLQHLFVPTSRYTSRKNFCGIKYVIRNNIIHVLCNSKHRLGLWTTGAFIPSSPDLSSAFWKRSPWSQYAQHVVEEVEVLNEAYAKDQATFVDAESRHNPYYNEEACRYFLVHILSSSSFCRSAYYCFCFFVLGSNFPLFSNFKQTRVYVVPARC